MPLSISNLRPATDAQWDQVYAACPYSTYFHSRAWAQIWQAYSAGQSIPVPQWIEFSDGCSALLPISQRRLPDAPIARIYSSHAGTYGGWLSADPLTADHARLLTRHLLDQSHELVWRLNPYDPLVLAHTPLPSEGEGRGEGLSNQASAIDHTLSLPLASAPGFNAIIKGWSKGHRAAITQARRKGVAVYRAQTSDDWHAYFDCYEDSLRRWGKEATSRYSLQLFDQLSRQPADQVQLWLAHSPATGDARRQVIAGALVLCSSAIAVYWHGAARADSFSYRPVHLLIHDAVQQACAAGLHYFDFNPSGGHHGVEAFKHGFAPTTLPAPLIRRIVQNSPVTSVQELAGRAVGPEDRIVTCDKQRTNPHLAAAD